MHAIVVASFAAFLISSCAARQKDATATASAGKGVGYQEHKIGNKTLLCEGEEPTGSRITRSKCRWKEQKEEEERDAQDLVRRVGSGRPDGS